MKLLLVEDSKRLQRSISAGLRNFGYAVDQAYDGKQGLSFGETNSYDVIILDLMLTEIDGLTVLARLRRKGIKSHVLILSAKDQMEDRVRGLNLGADDYLVKPFSFDELLARIRALLRRQLDSKAPVVEIGPICIDTLGCKVSFNGSAVHLTRSEFILLEYLVGRRGQVFSHDQIIDQLYDSQTYVTRNVVEVHISQIRKKLNAAGAPVLIKNKRGFGYVVE